MRLSLFLPATIVALVMSFSMSDDGQAKNPPRRSPAEALAAEAPIVIAHRGASAFAPENTAASFGEALAAQADLIELDYYVCKDGVQIVFHDKTLDRTSDAIAKLGKEKLEPADVDWDELCRLDAGAWFDAKFAGEKIPRLEDALDQIQAGSITLIERKSGDAQTLVDTLREKNLLDDVVVQAFDWKFVAEVARLEPRIAVGALGSKAVDADDLAALDAIEGLDFVGWSHADLNAATVAAFRERGWPVFAYTVNDPKQALTLVERGVHGIITDDPRGIREALSTPARP